MKLRHFVQKMKKNTLKDGLGAKKDAKRDVKSSFCCSVTYSSFDEDRVTLMEVLFEARVTTPISK